MNKGIKSFLLILCGVLALAWKPTNAFSQVNSGSNGSDDAFSPATNTVINMADHPNGIYQFTSVNIPGNVTVTFVPNANNTPVTWLVQSNCEIDGTVDVSGKSTSNTAGAIGGPGGGVGGNNGTNPSPGQGPGGGQAGFDANNSSIYIGGNASFGTAGNQGGAQASPGSIYGNNFLVPLLGGSGGGGGGSGGGGGGGAILIAANNGINIAGRVYANGGGIVYIGDPYYFNSTGSGGSGGAIRLVAPIISGAGTLSAGGGLGSGSGVNGGDYAGNGRIRLDTFNNNFSGQINGGVFSQGFQPIIIPAAGQGVQLSIVSVAGASVSATPNGQLVSPDAIISGQQANPISVVVSCSNLPLNTPITVTVKPATGSSVSAVGYNTAGTLASSTATVQLNMPHGGGLIYATATTSN